VRDAFDKRQLEVNAGLHGATVLAELFYNCGRLFTDDYKQAEIVDTTLLQSEECPALSCDKLTGQRSAYLHQWI
jgi:hypothetical protein